MRFFIIILILLGSFFRLQAHKIDKAYAALHQYDYFKAKKLFYQSLKKRPAEAGFGLATIYFKRDNPFHNLDSAYKYIQLCKQNDALLKTSKYLNQNTAQVLHDSISKQAYQQFLKKVSVDAAQTYLGIFYQSKYLDEVRCKRDSIWFDSLKNSTRSKPLYDFINCYPRSCYAEKAQQLYEYNLYEEVTHEKNDSAYLRYINRYPQTRYTQRAKQELLEYYINTKNEKGIYNYIKNISASYYVWEALFSVSVAHYSEKQLQLFLEKYPEYPEKKQLEEECTYWKTPLFLVKQNNQYGFIDSSGSIHIAPSYAEAEDFKENYALVQKNNLYGYINKAGRVKIDFQFDEASSFAQQTAIVKKNNFFFLIDHSGKKTSGAYDEIADFSDHTAIIKKENQYGAINTNGEEIIHPSFALLSDFSENRAAFMQNNLYGFINKQGIVVIPALYTWVSPYKNNQCRVKNKNLFGVLNKNGTYVIEPQYDFIDEAYQGIYVVVKNNMYGFMDTSGCYLSEIKYEYNPALKASMLTNGVFMRLIKNKKEELQDKNGIKQYAQQHLSNIQLSNTDIIAAQTKNKMQFYKTPKTNPLKKTYNKIQADERYWYAKTDQYVSVHSLDLKKELFSIKETDEVKKLNALYFSYTSDEGTGIINQNGAVVLPAFFDEINPTQQEALFYIIQNEKGAYYNANSLRFIWQENGFDARYIGAE
ncbi:MAG: WG repeat-containing protein [Bacteroidetes bacterium]|nr:WG repeat-containing protein [Bacteroidota bacterium]